MERIDLKREIDSRYLKAVGEYIQVIQFSDDLGTQESLMLSPSLYKRIIKPHHYRMFQYVRKNYPHIRILIHSCGAIRELLPDLLDAGVHAINPVQISARGMEPEKLKREFGKELVFWGGGVDMQFTVNNGTIESISEGVKELMDIFKPGGGFVFTQVHNIQENISPEKIAAIYKTAKSCSSYAAESGTFRT